MASSHSVSDQKVDHFELAKKVLNQVKKQDKVVSAHDVISTIELPYCYEDEIELYKKKFGEDRVKDYLNHIQQVDRTRAFVQYEIKYSISPIVSPVTTMYVATALTGVGECGELVNLSSMRLLEAGCKLPINVIGVMNSSNPDKNHSFIILGAMNMEDKPSFDSFDRLPDHCILIDPYLNIIGKANKAREIQGDFNKAWGIDVIHIVNKINPENRETQEQLAKILKQAVTIKTIVQSKIQAFEALMNLSLYKRSSSIVEDKPIEAVKQVASGFQIKK